MIRNQRKSIWIVLILFTLLLITLNQGCAEVEPTVDATPTQEVLAIPIAISPNVTRLLPGEKVVIGVVSEVWEAEELEWGVFSTPEDLSSQDDLSSSTGLTIIYQAPLEGSGTVTISVTGNTEGAIGSGTLSFSIEPEPMEGVIKYWTFSTREEWDRERANEFNEEFSGTLILITTVPTEIYMASLEKAIAAGEAPDVIRFPLEINIQELTEVINFNDDAATLIIQGVGNDTFNEKQLIDLVDPEDKTQWLAVPAENSSLAIMLGAEEKSVAEAWVRFLIEKELEGPSPQVTPTFPNTITTADGTTMILIPAGEFEMGSDIDRAYKECQELFIQGECTRSPFENEGPVHTVTLDEYYIDQYEVTNAKYAECVEVGFCNPPTSWGSETRKTYFGDSQFNNYPVIFVSWNDANSYCDWRGARLPTEAEWEKAARGTDGRLYPWGDSFDGNRVNFCDKNCSSYYANPEYDDGYEDTAPVGSYPEGVSIYGVYDMAGNVWEWVADWYDGKYYTYSPAKNPLGPSTGKDRVHRGGAWVSFSVRSTIRYYDYPLNVFRSVGFRCALTP